VQGLPARITINRRLYLLVYETDLSALWGLAPIKRLPALLAGLAFDTLVLTGLLGALLTARHDWWAPADVLERLLSALVLVMATKIAAQFFLFLRTDVYAVLVVLLGCLNLSRVTHLLLMRRFRSLTAAEAKELEEADPATSRSCAVRLDQARWPSVGRVVLHRASHPRARQDRSLDVHERRAHLADASGVLGDAGPGSLALLPVGLTILVVVQQLRARSATA
jgi:hypothetical protein